MSTLMCLVLVAVTTPAAAQGGLDEQPSFTDDTLGVFTRIAPPAKP